MPHERQTPADEFERVRRGLLRIARESVVTDTPFPGEVELARRLDCGRGQVRRVMGSLEHEGIVVRRQGVPTRIDPVTLALSMRFDDRKSIDSQLRESGYVVTTQRLSSVERVAGAPSWARLEADEVRMIVTTHLFFADGQPAAAEQAEMIAAENESPLSSDVDEQVWNAWQEPVLWDVASLKVLAPPATISAALETAPQTALPTMESVHIARSGRHLARTLRWHRPEYFTFTVLRSSRPRWDEPLSPGTAPRVSASDDEDDR